MTECSISKYSSFKKNGRNNQRAKQKCVHRIDGKLQWHQVATLPKSPDVGTSGCVRGSSGKPGVPTDPGGGEPLRRASRFALVSIVSQSEVSSWNWDRSCSTQQQMGTRHPCRSEDIPACLKGLGQSGPQTLGTSPPASLQREGPLSGVQLRLSEMPKREAKRTGNKFIVIFNMKTTEQGDGGSYKVTVRQLLKVEGN